MSNLCIAYIILYVASIFDSAVTGNIYDFKCWTRLDENGGSLNTVDCVCLSFKTGIIVFSFIEIYDNTLFFF
jgi:hypothetical protein